MHSINGKIPPHSFLFLFFLLLGSYVSLRMTANKQASNIDDELLYNAFMTYFSLDTFEIPKLYTNMMSYNVSKQSLSLDNPMHFQNENLPWIFYFFLNFSVQFSISQTISCVFYSNFLLSKIDWNKSWKNKNITHKSFSVSCKYIFF